MSFRFLGRMVAAATLVAASAGVLAAAPAGAANTAITQSCVTQYQTVSVNNSDTVTITISGSSCGYAVLNMPNGNQPFGTATLNGAPMTAGSPIGVSNGDVIIYTAPASGSGTDGFAFLPNLQSPPGAQINIVFPPGSGSIVDNGNNTATVTYSGNIVLFLMAPGSTCAPTIGNGPVVYLYVGDSMQQSPFPLPASPFTLSTSTLLGVPGQGGPPPAPGPVAAGAYQACMYDTTAYPSPLLTSAAVNLGAPTPDPVTPSFTG